MGAAATAICVTAVAAEPIEDQSRKSTAAQRTDQPPKIDGKLDDAAWATAQSDDRFTQLFPSEGTAPTERTELRFLYDDDALYVGVRLHDSNPAGIVSRLTRRDRVPESDAVVVRFDSRHDHSTTYTFRLHASGVQFDGMLYDDGNGLAPEWDAVWAGEVSTDGQGWTAEFRIPLSALRFTASPSAIFGLQIERYISRSGETDVWSFWPSTVPGEVSHYGHLTGLDNLQTRRTLELRPYALSRVRGSTPSGVALLGSNTGGQRKVEGDLGLDLKLGVTSGLTFDATINPDFGQIEADSVVLNLSRFETFFPEKRSFFLEGQELYATPIQLFHSQRIGSRPVGFEVGSSFVDDGGALTVTEASPLTRIWGAAKLTGKIGSRFSVGVVEAVTDAETVTVSDAMGGVRDVTLAPSSNYAAVRGRYAFDGPSFVGFMGTAVNRLGGNVYSPVDDHDEFAQSVDGLWQSATATWRLGGQWAMTERVGGSDVRDPAGGPCSVPPCVPITRTDGTRLAPGDVGYGLALRGAHFGPHLFQEAEYDLLSPKLDPNRLGFLVDYNKHGGSVTLGYRELKPAGIVQNYSIVAGQAVAFDFRRTAITNSTSLEGTLQLTSLHSFKLGGRYDWMGIWDTRETLDGARFEQPARVEVHAVATSDTRRAVTADITLSHTRSLGDRERAFTASSNLGIRVISPLELTLTPAIGIDSAALRFHDCSGGAGVSGVGMSCDVDMANRHYRFADLDSGFISLTTTGTYAFTSHTSLQLYAQLFMARGEWSRYREIDTTVSRPTIRRGELMASSFNGDSDGDGVKDDDFERVSLNASVVFRWEPWPGSTLFAVYTREQRANPLLAGQRPRFSASPLTDGPTDDVVAVKLVYYWSR